MLWVLGFKDTFNSFKQGRFFGSQEQVCAKTKCVEH